MEDERRRVENTRPIEWEELAGIARRGDVGVVRAVLSVTPERSWRVAGSEADLAADLAAVFGPHAVTARSEILVREDLERAPRDRDDAYLSVIVLTLPPEAAVPDGFVARGGDR